MKNKKILFLSLLALIFTSCGGGNDISSSSDSSYQSESVSIETSSEANSSSENNSTEEILSSENILSSEESSSNSNFDISSSEFDSSIVETKLNTPSLKLDNDLGIVSWDKIEGASHYNYIINDGEIKSTTANTITINNESNISVQAASETSVSDWSYAITYFDTSDIIVDKVEDIYVYFHNSGINPIKLNSGDKVNKPANPTKANCTFDNWYKDPYLSELFDFDTPIYESTIIYANYVEDDLIKDTYFWIKANQKITSSVIGNTSSSGWKFIPLKLNEKASMREYYATITVSGASSSDPAAFLIMDGFADNSGRTYWKNNGSDFTISNDGIYNIYFSLETQYNLGGNIVHAYYEVAQNSSLKYVANNEIELATPQVNIDSENNKAVWEAIDGASTYEVIINNGNVQETTNNYITLNKGEHISVRAINASSISSWSIPKANRNIIQKEDEITYAFVYFFDSNISAIKVNINESINAPINPSKDDYTFDGWYLDIALTNKAIFPYTVLKNTVFYPKWVYNDNYETKEYYKLVDSENVKIAGLTWNLNNYDFLEYETGEISLKANTNYYVKSLDESVTYGPYTVNTTGNYEMYFSEDYVWNANTENESHVYFAYVATGKINVYFTNNSFWSGTIYAYMWKDSTGNYLKSWPGTEMTYAKTNSYNQNIYKIEVDLSLYDYIIFNNGSSQTCNIPLKDAYDGIGYYINGSSYGTYEFA